MSYTVKQLAKLSGVSVRTLHHYDDIGLLKPAYHGGNSYRYYEEEQLLMLQQILFYRELNMPLNDIKRLIGTSDFDKIAALNSHKKLLLQQLDRTHALIETIDKTTARLRGKKAMKDKELFYGFDSAKQKGYEKWLVETGVCTEEQIASGRDQAKDFDWKKQQGEWDSLFKKWAQAIDKGLSPDSAPVQTLVRLHYEYVKRFWTPNREKFIGLTEMYHAHPDWAKFYGSYHPKLLEFLCEAMKVFAQRELS